MAQDHRRRVRRPSLSVRTAMRGPNPQLYGAGMTGESAARIAMSSPKDIRVAVIGAGSWGTTVAALAA